MFRCENSDCIVLTSEATHDAEPHWGANERGGRMKSVAFRYASEVTAMARWFIAIGVLTLGVAGCQTPYPAAPVVAATPDYDYHIGPLDTVNIIVWRNPEYG